MEAGFIQAKSLAVLGNGVKSAEILYDIIQTERFYAVKSVSDSDLAPKIEIQSMLQKLRDDAVRQARERINKIKNKMTGRNHGAQNALFHARLSQAEELGCTLAVMGALTGSQSQKNAQKNGFSVAYTRTKWQLKVPLTSPTG